MATNNMTFEQQVVELTNQERAKNGLAPLKENAELNYAADEYAEQMSETGVLSHTAPDGSRPWDRAKAVGYEAQTMGENIAAGQKTPEQVVADWMNSPGHRANILNPKYTEIGVGFDDNYWVQKFGSGDLNPDSYIPNSSSSDTSGSSKPTPQPGDDTDTGSGETVKPPESSQDDDVIEGSPTNDQLNGGNKKKPLTGDADVDMLTGDQGRNVLPGGKDKNVLKVGDWNKNLLDILFGGRSDRLVYGTVQDQDVIAGADTNQNGSNLRQILAGQVNSGQNQFSDYLKPKNIGGDTTSCFDVFDNTKLGGFDNSSVMPNLDASKLTSGNFMK
ncbi:SCP-like extracellular [Fischerella thermalis BR2B]|uniref:SCP-like extracellular n=1 Tax=Fischerella thermalis JSC-11 TaxID=741277 RepID=G6FUS6_9CYAN|nr:CAP domain-containing protein [Fischerella thermalis]EHC13006.1 SCP-like extracellular [Fischerella thermalis JSC-11]PLZ06728.1 SCP-like extracellular [Fischerella thermalis WC119]PLZ72536.1 SCP-like extracellular [Fischerella thermalis WC245]PMB35733.1 SCP-like extracellular [Fischerella thermalis BR2B]PMB37613.1 SCP-like extracellular [Fischerella thermalis CCMEE 5208]